MTDFEKVGQKIADDLDASKPDDVAKQLSQYSQQLSRDDFRKLIKTVDEKEKDDKGLDLIIKYDSKNTPVQYSILPKELHASAKKMAELMDKGKTADAVELLNKTATDLDKQYPKDPKKVQQEFSRWSLAVDTYEKDGVGSDVSIDLKKTGVDGISWQFEKIGK